MSDASATPPHPDDDEDDDLELEIEPVDPEILAREKQRVAEKAKRAEASIEFDDLYDRSEADELMDFNWVKDFRFTTRHLLVATALLAIYFTLINLFNFAAGTFVAFLLSVSYGWWFVRREEARKEAELEKRRAAYKARLRAERKGEPLTDGRPPLEFDASPDDASPNNAVGKGAAFRPSFSVKELLIGMTVAAVFLASAKFVGGTDNLALLLGFLSLGGLLVNAFGFEPPKQVTLAWWWLLVLYIGVSLWSAFIG
ncbi:MAG: hypothetical protein AAGA92_04230 [Planctomycetota bacterium]